MATQNANAVAITGGTISGLGTALPVASGGTGVTTSTGTGAVVLGTSPTITTPTLNSPTINTPTMGGSVITSGTTQASTSGTSIDFTSIPSWVKRVTVMFYGVSTSGTSIVQIQLGSTSVQTTGYVAAAANDSTGTALTSGFPVNDTSSAAAETRYGSAIFSSLGSNIWTGNGTLHTPSGNSAIIDFAGGVTLSGALDRVRITTVNGTDTFDAGSINILYE
jgi:hypothetical protein